MPKAVWNGVPIAESDDTVVVEGNHYFPRAALREDLIRPSDTHTFCPWKGTASSRTRRTRPSGSGAASRSGRT